MQTVNVLQHLLPGYEFLSQIGHGLGGETWLAQGPEGLVAVKILSQRKARSPPAFARMLGEAMVLTTVKHPNVVPYQAFVHDSARGVAALVMRYIPGGDLEDFIRRQGPLDSRTVARMGTLIVSALEALHSAGYVHRDLKPRNVLVEATASGEHTLFLADFGISQPLVDGVAQARFVALTPGYAAPEQWHTVHLGQSIDTYALGAVLWYMYTGLHPGENFELPGPEVVFGADPPRQLTARLIDPADKLLCRLMADMMDEQPDGRPELAQVHDRLRDILGAPRPATTWGTELFDDGSAQDSPQQPTTTQTLEPDSEPGASTLALFEASTVVAPSPLAPQQQAPPGREGTRKDKAGARERNPSATRLSILFGAVAVFGALVSIIVIQGVRLIGGSATKETPEDIRSPGVTPEESQEILVVPEGAFTWRSETPEGSDRPSASPTLNAGRTVPTSQPTSAAGSSTGSVSPEPTTSLPAEPTYGTVSVNVSRGWAEVYIDGKKVETTPLANFRIPSGPHVIKVIRPDTGYEETKQVVVRSGKDEYMSFDLP